MAYLDDLYVGHENDGATVNENVWTMNFFSLFSDVDHFHRTMQTNLFGWNFYAI